MRNNPKPVRLCKQEDEFEQMKKLLNAELVFKIKFYTVMIIALIIFLVLCFLVQHETYGFINW